MELVQTYSDKTGTAREQCTFAKYLVHAVLLTFIAEFRRHLIASSHSLAGLLSSCCGNVLDDILIADYSGNCDTWPVKTPPEVLELGDVVSQTKLSKEHEKPLRVLH